MPWLICVGSLGAWVSQSKPWDSVPVLCWPTWYLYHTEEKMWFCVNAFLLMFTGSFMQFMHAQFLANALIFHADPLNRKLLLNIKSCSSKTFKHITALIAHYKGGTQINLWRKPSGALLNPACFRWMAVNWTWAWCFLSKEPIISNHGHWISQDVTSYVYRLDMHELDLLVPRTKTSPCSSLPMSSSSGIRRRNVESLAQALSAFSTHCPVTEMHRSLPDATTWGSCSNWVRYLFDLQCAGHAQTVWCLQQGGLRFAFHLVCIVCSTNAIFAWRTRTFSLPLVFDVSLDLYNMI